MSLTLSQNLVLKIIYLLAYLVGFVDRYAVFSFKINTKLLSEASLILVDVLFVFFIFFSIHTGYANAVLEGYMVDSYGDFNFNLGDNVLGVSEKISLPVVKNNINPPVVSAKSILIWDIDNSEELYSLNKAEKSAPASTTKLMTALVALDIYSLDEKLEVPGECTLVDSTRVNYPSGEIFTIEDLLYSLLIASAGDSACVLSSGRVDYDSFVEKMNSKAVNFGMKNTHFTNPVGLDGINGGHYSTVDDLLKLSLSAIKNPFISEIVKTPSFYMSSEDYEFTTELVNTNKLLWDIPQTVGVKTGRTEEAGEVLIYQYKDEEKNILIIVMGSDDRFKDTRELLNWILDKYSWNVV